MLPASHSPLLYEHLQAKARERRRREKKRYKKKMQACNRCMLLAFHDDLPSLTFFTFRPIDFCEKKNRKRKQKRARLFMYVTVPSTSLYIPFRLFSAFPIPSPTSSAFPTPSPPFQSLAILSSPLFYLYSVAIFNTRKTEKWEKERMNESVRKKRIPR